MLYLDIDCTMSIDVTKGSPMSEIRFNLHSVVILFTPFLPNKQTQLSCTQFVFLIIFLFNTGPKNDE